MVILNHQHHPAHQGSIFCLAIHCIKQEPKSSFRIQDYWSDLVFLLQLCCCSSFSVPFRISSIQCLLLPCECRWPDAARAFSPGCPAGPRNPPPCSSDPHPEPRRGGVCCHHQHLNAPRLHWRKGLRQGVGHQPAGQQEPHGPAGLSGET